WVKSVASQIQELGGFVPDILKNDTLLLPEDLKCILRQQYDRLSETEKQVISLLAREREPISLGGLLEMAAMPPADCLNSIQSLLRRCWLENPDNLYRLPKAIKQYIIHHFI
ncbi:ATP-binding protein, partial [Arthrospira sp. PCC 8006]